MNIVELSVVLGFSLIFLAWVLCMISWVKRGMPIPRYIHFLAILLTLAGAAVLIFTLTAGLFDWKLGLGCLALPAPSTYLAWLWIFGPDFASQSKGTTKDSADHPPHTDSTGD